MSIQIGMPGLRLTNQRIIEIADDAMENRRPLRADGAQIDIWSRQCRRLPDNAVFVLGQEKFIQFICVDQLIWFNRTTTTDELWVYSEAESNTAALLGEMPDEERASLLLACCHSCQRVFSVPRHISYDESLVELFAIWLSSDAGGQTEVEHLIAGGYVGRDQYELFLDRVRIAWERQKQVRDAHSRIARESETEIILAARELKLHPEPAGIGPVQWYARCPHTSHRLMITTGHEEFGCGYCQVKGGVTELRRFVAEQNEQYDERVRQHQMSLPPELRCGEYAKRDQQSS